MEDCWGREKESLWELAGLQEQPPQSMRQPIASCRKSNKHGERPAGMNIEHLIPEFKYKNEVCVSFLNQQFHKNKSRTKDLYCSFLLRLKNYGTMFLNACIIFVKWDKDLSKPLKLPVPGQWTPHNFALISFLSYCWVEFPSDLWDDSKHGVSYAAKYGPCLNQPDHKNELLVFQISTACYTYTAF